jgi:hypothetical protein
MRNVFEDVDARNKCGHDQSEIVAVGMRPQKPAARSMVNHVLTLPYLWWIDPLPAGLKLRPAAPKVLALQVWP